MHDSAAHRRREADRRTWWRWRVRSRRARARCARRRARHRRRSSRPARGSTPGAGRRRPHRPAHHPVRGLAVAARRPRPRRRPAPAHAPSPPATARSSSTPTLPGGVLGDVDRACSTAGTAGTSGRGLRAVVWERTAGQVVLVALTGAALVLLPSPFDRGPRRRTRGVGGSPGSSASSLAVLRWRPSPRPAAPARTGTGRARCARMAPTCGRGAARPHAVGESSLASVAGRGRARRDVRPRRPHGRGGRAHRGQLLPLALVVLLGWGCRSTSPAGARARAPRRGPSPPPGWVRRPGVATAVAYGVMAFVGTLPGAALLVGRCVARPTASGRAAGGAWAARG